MTATPETAIPAAPRLSEFMKRTDELPADSKQAKGNGRDPAEIELRRRIIQHGQNITSLSDLEKFCRERFPEWFLRDERPDPNPRAAAYRPGYRSGQYCCRALWASFLADLET